MNPLTLTSILSPEQNRVLNDACQGEETDCFLDILTALGDRLLAMPRTGDTVRGPTVFLHYFNAGSDWWITELDSETDQHQAFGLASINGEYPELGYISLVELAANHVELDLCWTPCRLDAIKHRRVAA